MLDLLVAGGKLLHTAAVDDIHLGAETLGAAGSVHCDVAAADDGDLLAPEIHQRGISVFPIGFHEVDTGEELVGRIHAAKILAGDMHEHRKTGTGADEHRLKAVFAHQLIDGNDATDDHIGLNLDAERLQTVHFLLHNRLGKSEFGNAVNEDAAGKVERFKHGDLIALLGKVAGAGQSAGTGADDGDLVSVGSGLGRRFADVGIVPVGDKALKAADADRLALDGADALALALRLLRADTTADGGKRGGLVDDLIRALVILFGDLLNEFGDLDLNRAAGNALRILAVQAAGSLVKRLLLGIAEGDLEEVLIADIGVLRGHFVFLQAHVSHLT